MKTKWPKKVPIAQYIQCHFPDGGRGRHTIINDIRRNDLPGEKIGGRWYVYLLPDNTPAYGYSSQACKGNSAAQVTDTICLTGNSKADAILANIAIDNGLRVST